MEVAENTAIYGEIDSVDFAVYLNNKAKKMGLDVNVTKIQKWLYICYGLYLAAEDKQLLKERPKAWDYGPVFPRVHNVQKKEGLDNSELKLPIDEYMKYDEVIDATLGHFGKWTASELVAWTHKKGMAWHVAYNQEDGKYGLIDTGDILRDFEGFVTK